MTGNGKEVCFKLHKFIFYTLLRTIVAAGTAIWFWSWAVPAAKIERGYNAVGGEWLLIIAAYAFALWLTKKQQPLRKTQEGKLQNG